MSFFIRFIIFLSTSIALVGCSSLGEKYKPESIDPDKAIIYVFGDCPDLTEQPGFYVDEAKIAKVHEKGYIVVKLDPGEHTLALFDEFLGIKAAHQPLKGNKLTLSLEPGGVYYFKASSYTYRSYSSPKKTLGGFYTRGKVYSYSPFRLKQVDGDTLDGILPGKRKVK